MAGKVGSAISGAIGVGVRAAGVAVAGLAGVISANLGGAIERADMLNNFPKVMANIGYSADEAREQIDRISSSLDGLPTSTQAVAQTVKGLAPLTGSLESATDVALALNDALLAGGASATLAENAMEQYRQMLAVGKVDMAAWRSLQSAMPGQLDQIAKSLLGAAANSSELYDAMQNGNVTFEQFNDALVKLDGEGLDGLASFHDQAITATAGIGTAFQNARNRIVKAIASVIEAIGVDEISAKINAATSGIVGLGSKIADAITAAKKDGGFEGIGATIGGLAPVIGGVAGALGPLLAQIPVVGGLFSGLTGPVGVVIGLFGSMVASSQTLRDAITGAFSGLQKAISGSGTQTALKGLSDALGTVARTMGDSLGKAINQVAPLLSQMAATVLPLLANVLRTVAVAVTPIATTIIGAISQALAAILPTITNIARTVLPALASIVRTVAAALVPVIDVIAGIFVDAIKIIAPIFEQLVKGLMPPLQSAIQAIAPVLAKMLVTIGNMARQVLPALGKILGAVVSVVVKVSQAVLPTLVKVINGVIKVVTSVINVVSAALVPAINVASKLISAAVRVIGNIFTWLWDKAVRPVADWITGKMNTLANFFDNTVKPKIANVANKIGDAFQKMKDTVGDAFNKIKAKAARPINFVIGTVYTDGIKKLVDNIMSKLGLSLRMPTISKISGYASGGVLPGYTPGRDVYHFISPDGGGVLALSGGEAIMRPEWVRAVGGPAAVDVMNRAASRGGRIPGGDIGAGRRGGQTAFALGGIWGKVKSGVAGGLDWLKNSASAVADIITDPLGAVKTLVQAPVDAMLGGFLDSGAFWDIGKAIPGKIISGVGDWLKKKTATMSASGLVDMARKAIGTPYVWGGVNVPGGVDCSGLIVWALRQMGKNVPRHTASSFQAASTPGDRNTPGNLLFWGGAVGRGGAYHVAIASGRGMMVEAPRAGLSVVERPIWGSPSAGVFKYDSGGWLQPGLTTTLNATGKPEAVFTQEQLAAMSRPWPEKVTLVDSSNSIIGELDVRIERAVGPASRGRLREALGV
ncbi:tape measure protein [Actinomyces sp. 432]|uniref:tape measure protein n=1 Tax=Actinomyces sp. 432 TaxID=2057798 RepID=UPI003075BD32